MLINVAGPSGVGKTTMATILSIVLSQKNTDILNLCGDDLHKWPRDSKKWNSFTHLNPDANNLDIGKSHILNLLQGNSINRDSYNHETGRFIKNILIKPSDVIINEGLHSLYDKEICELASLNIYVNTSNDLKYQWKLNRDILQRGYTKDEVKKTLDHRKHDEISYIEPQKNNADIIVSFREKSDRSVELSYTSTHKYGIELMKRVTSFYNSHRHFLLTCRKSCFEYELIQGAGGNLSYKFEDKIIITSSGYSWPRINILNGFSVCYLDGTTISDNQKRPSMEIGFHTKIKDKVIYHTHPIYLNTILCSKESENILKDILSEYNYTYVKYYSPGSDLCKNLKNTGNNKIILLENHGLICCGESFSQSFKESLNINQICKEWLVCNSKTFKMLSLDTSNINKDCILFPDAAIKPDDNLKINDYMVYNHREAGLTSNCLPPSEIHKLKNMESEKYRMDLK